MLTTHPFPNPVIQNGLSIPNPFNPLPEFADSYSPSKIVRQPGASCSVRFHT